MATQENHDWLSVGGYGSLSERLSKMRHDVRGCLTIIVSGCDMIRLKPELTEKYLTQFSGKSKRIIELIDAFSHDFEKNASLCDQLSLILPKLKYGSPGQEASAGEALNAQAAEIELLEQQLADVRMKALEAALQPELQEAALRQLATEASNIEISLTLLRAKAIAAIKPQLTDAQRASILQTASQ